MTHINECLLCECPITEENKSEDKELCKECFGDVALTDEELMDLQEFLDQEYEFEL